MSLPRMNQLRLIAGSFCGAGALMLVGIGAWRSDMALVAIGSNLLTGLMAFFVGEKNGQKIQAKAPDS